MIGACRMGGGQYMGVWLLAASRVLDFDGHFVLLKGEERLPRHPASIQ